MHCKISQVGIRNCPMRNSLITTTIKLVGKMSPFQALYGRSCRTPLLWDQPGERHVFDLDVLLEAEENIKMVRENLKIAQSRQRSYADTRFGVKGKLAPRYIGSF